MKRSNLWDPDGPIKRSRAERQHQPEPTPYRNYASRPFYNVPQPPHALMMTAMMMPNQMGILGPGPANHYLGGNRQYVPHSGPAPHRYSPMPRTAGNGARDDKPSGRRSTPPRSGDSFGGSQVNSVEKVGNPTKPTRNTDDAYPKITQSIMEYVRTNGQTSDMLKTKFRLRGEFEVHLRRLFPNSDLFIFGSSASGFGSTTSDMDMCLVTNNNVHLKDVKLLYRIRSVLCSVYPLIDVQVIPAKVPILKFVHKPSQIQCDLGINNSDGVRNTHLLKFFTRCDPRFVPLVLTVKRWARHHKINDASQGTLSSYALTLMVLHYLQAGVKPPVLPNLIWENPDVFHPHRPLQKLSFHDPVRSDFVSDNDATVGELFYGFLAYFSKEFRYDYLGISVREARAIAKRTNKEFSKWIFIEEPYNMDNVARAVRQCFEPYIQKVIDESFSVISQTKDLESILTFHVEMRERPPGLPPLPTSTAKPTSSAIATVTSTARESADEDVEEDLPGTSTAKSEVADLYELASKRQFNVTFDVVGESGPSHAKVFVTRCSVILKKGGQETLMAATGKANNKKQSKTEAAKEMMRLLDERKVDVSAKESFP